MMLGYMLDTNAFDSILDNSIPAIALGKIRLFATHVQLNELRAAQTRYPERAEALLKLFYEVTPHSVVTESAVWDVSEWDHCKWSSDDGLFERMLALLAQLDAASGKKKRGAANRQRDILIAETALKNGHVLVSGDQNLRFVAIRFGGQAISFDELMRTESGATSSRS